MKSKAKQHGLPSTGAAVPTDPVADLQESQVDIDELPEGETPPAVQREAYFREPPDDIDPTWEHHRHPAGNAVVSIQIPVAITGDDINDRGRFDFRPLTKKQRFGLNVLAAGMECNGARTDMGYDVTSRPKAVRRLLEIIADAYVGAVAKSTP